jgi:hypothetical protein
MVLLGDEAQVKARFSLFGHSVDLNARWVGGLHECTIMLVNHFRHTRCTIKLGNHFVQTRWNS